jgi:hypothetical protein
MTIDERLEKLAERHESLAHSVEMLVIENRNLGKFVHEIALGTAHLLSIVEAHENGITRLEGQL